MTPVDSLELGVSPCTRPHETSNVSGFSSVVTLKLLILFYPCSGLQ